MNYLFFDIECANCFKNHGKICEFGYVLTDSSFNILKKENFIINPDAKFDKYVITNMLTYDKATYKASEKYPYYYNSIKQLINGDVMIFGHSIDSDARYLNDEAVRYNLPFFNYKFYDVMHIYKGYSNEKEGLGLKKIAIELGSYQQENEHRALDDALATMDILRTLCSRLDVDVNTLTSRYEDCVGETKKGKITTIYLEKAKVRRQKKNEERLKRKREIKKKVATIK